MFINIFSGLAIVSKHNFTEVEFNTFTYHGDALKALVDGESLARKGVGRVRITPAENLTVDIFVTHTAADPDPSHGYDNSYYRVRQVAELMESYVTKSDADIVSIVYLLVCHVPFPAQGAGFLLQCTKCSRQARRRRA